MSSKSSDNIDLVGSEHWDSIWKKVKKRKVSKLNYYNSILINLFSNYVREGTKFIEIGCGGSIWLPFLAKAHKAEVWGVDYSQAGIERSVEADIANGTKTNLILADIFADNSIPKSHFDVIWSNGFIEHFTNPTEVISIFKSYLNPAGVIITMVPNMNGLPGLLQKYVDYDTYLNHQKIDPAWLDHIHREAGLIAVKKSAYFGIFSLGVVNYLKLFKNMRLYKIWMTAISIFQQTILLPLRVLPLNFNSRFFSPYVVTVYKLK